MAEEEAVVEEEAVEVPDTILRSEVQRGGQADAAKVFAALLAHGSVSLEEDPEEEPAEAEAEPEE